MKKTHAEMEKGVGPSCEGVQPATGNQQMCSTQANSIWVRAAKAGPQSASFCKYGFTGTQPRPFISILSRAALVLESSEVK